MCSSNRIPCSSLAWHIFVAVHSPSKVLWVLHVVEHLSRSLSLQQVVVVLLLCKMAKQDGKQWSFLLLGLWLAFWPQTPPLSLFDLGSVAATGAVFAGLNSDWYQTYKATNRFMSSYQVSEKENIVKREVVEAIKNDVREWKMKDHATIISGREMAGQTVAVEEALGGTRGVFRFSIKYADWKSLMYQYLGVKDANMFKQVLRRVCKRLAKHPDNLTKFPILLLDIPRETPTGRSLVSFETINLKNISFQVSSHEAPWDWFLPRRTSLQPMQPVIFQLMSRPLLSKLEVGRSP